MGNCLSRSHHRRVFPVSSTRVLRQLPVATSQSVACAGDGDSIFLNVPSSPRDKEDGLLASSCPSLSVTPTHKEIVGPTHRQFQNLNLENEAFKAMVTCHNQLVTTLATDYLNVAGLLLAQGFISDEVSAKMLLPSSTPNEKATTLIAAVRERIKITPQRYPELVKLFSEHSSTKCIVNLLQSAYQGKWSHICEHVFRLC